MLKVDLVNGSKGVKNDKRRSNKGIKNTISWRI